MCVNKNNKEEHINKSQWPIFGFCQEKYFVFLIMNSLSSKISPVVIHYKRIPSSSGCKNHRWGLMESGRGSTVRLETKSGAHQQLWPSMSCRCALSNPQVFRTECWDEVWTSGRSGGGYQFKIAINSKFLK